MATTPRSRPRPPIDARILIAGEPRVGKSTTFKRLGGIPKEEALRSQRTFIQDTLAIRYTYDDGSYMVLELVDIAGDMDAAPLVRPYYSNIDGVLLMCDVTRAATLASLADRWLPEIQRHRTGFGTAPEYMLIVNQCDRPDVDKQIDEKDAVLFCKTHHIRRYTMSSAATWSWATHPNPIEKFFLRLVQACLMRPPPRPEEVRAARHRIRLYHGPQAQAGRDDDDDDDSELRSNCVLCEQ